MGCRARNRIRVRGNRLAAGVVGLVTLAGVACATELVAEGVAGSHESAALAAAPPPVSHVVILGDSISNGLGASHRALSYAALLCHNDDAAYPEERDADLAHLFGAAVRYVNVAHSGDRTRDVLETQLPRLSADPAAEPAALTFPVHGHVLVLLTAGGNDLKSELRTRPDFTGATMQTALANLRAIFAFFRDPARFPDGASIFFGNVYDITDGEDQAHACLAGLAFPGISDAAETWSRAFAALAQEQGATLVDLLTLFRGHGFNYANPNNPYFHPRDPTLWIYDRDCLHPNNRGHHMLRRAFFGAMTAAPTVRAILETHPPL
jgi:lysophospholipase L1-like esterase